MTVIDLHSARNKAFREANKEMGSAGVSIQTEVSVLDSTGHNMIVGDVYEMYAPTAKQAAKTTGLVWHNPDFTFTYLGVLHMGRHTYIVSDDIEYDVTNEAVNPDVASAMELTHVLIGGYPLCPTDVPYRR